MVLQKLRIFFKEQQTFINELRQNLRLVIKKNQDKYFTLHEISMYKMLTFH